MNRKNLLLTFLLIILATLITACQPVEPDNSADAFLERENCVLDENSLNEISIGVVVPLTEPGAVSGGQVMVNAFQMAAEEINQAGGVLGKQISLEIEDTAGTPALGKDAATKLITEDCVIGLVGEYHSAVALEIMEVAHDYHVPTIFAETYSDAITASGYPEIFRIAPTSSFTAQMDAKWMAEVGDYNADGRISALIILEESSFGEAQSKSVSAWFPEYGIEFDRISVEFNEKDFSRVLNEITRLDSPPDIIFIKVTGDSSLVLLNQIIEAHIAPNENTLVVANQVALDTEKYWQYIPNGNFVIVPRIGPWPSTVGAFGKGFAQNYHELYEKWPEAFAFEAYDSLWLMADAVNRADTLIPDQVINALENADIELAAGRYYFPYGTKDPGEGFVPDYMWHQWPDVPLLFLQYSEVNQNAEDMTVIWPKLYRSSENAYLTPEG